MRSGPEHGCKNVLSQFKEQIEDQYRRFPNCADGEEPRYRERAEHRTEDQGRKGRAHLTDTGPDFNKK
jgi:hypothetical protein